ncbi:hypothetical protein [Streptomyces sp. NBC_01518]|uniref:hypothetical protein n=1 Tax=Streptomyces sp. NBC_01518 TaxID=2903891 RepID=UPI003866C4DC
MQAEERHIRLVDDLLDRLAATGRKLPGDARILVLGAAHGTHDLEFVKHGLDVTNIDIQPETSALGERRAVLLPAWVRYVVADMTRGLPDDVPAGSMTLPDGAVRTEYFSRRCTTPGQSNTAAGYRT